MNRLQLCTPDTPVLVAVEVGVWRGDFSAAMINHLKPAVFFAVDPYELFEGMVSAPGPEFTNQRTLDKLAEQVQNRMSSLGHNLIRKKSVDAAEEFKNNSIDVVYIDGDHTYGGVKADIGAWWPKVKPGGILAGHDYCTGKTGLGYEYGVIEAVQEFANAEGLDIETSTDYPPSWKLIKE